MGDRALFLHRTRREPEYAIIKARFSELASDALVQDGEGVICAAGSDASLPTSLQIPEGLSTVWHWPRESGLFPADVYLRHCLLAVRKAPLVAHQSFLDDTFLVDRTTTLRQYLESGEESVVMACEPPSELAVRFGG
uniref:Uncharacterized protein n=1 Tax=Coccolithus braarudii TaxID=221442 RepID=A0A7S0LFV7_9EUKA|mmetsp:Transcript_38331/g.81698  ORF Transcript_38331/g.81698 Transcript_38331/m.81698 type:complete len:137 (+) Transcript_38331:160-570(+)